ncbi:hypothetical protein JX265_003793 [Neoarthrinium moseri]|uniref:N-acetyltransferase domain-containing protein n=1 Tax=Neoarthrinium moseri TaxID=1658444 RepID=A0A9P9WSJ1_9PEZI|nr:hypothetical protein JX266_009953 [Neoarthrinium moseri]KAI1877785.1 hypothetical protein JX265_003793 [Neoarthrinium moseri]
MADGHLVTQVISGTTVPASTATPIPSARPPKPELPANVEIRMAPPSAAQDEALVVALQHLVNLVYSETEGDIFFDGYQRINAAEMRQILEAGELAVVYSSSQGAEQTPGFQSRPVGCIRIQRRSDTTGEFGMFAIEPTYRGGGMGRKMVEFAEDHCQSQGLTAMQLELLVPVGFKHGFKTRLLEWYTRMGYRLIKLGDFQDDYPQLAPLLRGPTEYRVFEKSLVVSG